jgi:hypothetical protein
VAMPWLRRSVAGFSPRRPGFAPGSVHVEFVVDKVALGQIFLLSISFCRCSPYWCVIWGMNNRPVSGRIQRHISTLRHDTTWHDVNYSFSSPSFYMPSVSVRNGSYIS